MCRRSCGTGVNHKALRSLCAPFLTCPFPALHMSSNLAEHIPTLTDDRPSIYMYMYICWCLQAGLNRFDRFKHEPAVINSFEEQDESPRWNFTGWVSFQHTSDSLVVHTLRIPLVTCIFHSHVLTRQLLRLSFASPRRIYVSISFELWGRTIRTIWLHYFPSPLTATPILRWSFS